MKSLDEVIKAVHHCGLLTGFDDTYEYDGGCPYEDCSKCEQKRMLGKDIIHYLMQLKLFRSTQLMQGIHKAQKECAVYPVEDWGEENPELTWQEISDLYHGEPVWIEWNDDDPDTPEEDWDGDWFLALYCVNNPVALFITLSKNEHRQYFYQDYLGKRWKAYRRRK